MKPLKNHNINGNKKTVYAKCCLSEGSDQLIMHDLMTGNVLSRPIAIFYGTECPALIDTDVLKNP